ncbi:hypothetical protein [uncultured Zobellia sp.]|uniref:hypothetical protein n=1 Tax=uncultured Zobellia sp. TaxID=255433 RepID=UPI00259381DB|nr:hypothetical protein [uncultured Zobellia sp.]
MKKYTFLVVLSVFISCGQVKKDNKDSQTMVNDISNLNIQDINATNVVDYMAAQVKTYDKHPMYAIRPLQNNCIFTILVNGELLYKEFTLEKAGTPIMLNSLILKTGEQTLTYRLYPIGDLMVQEYGKGETVTTLKKNTSMSLKIIRYDDFKTGRGLSDEIIIAEHTSPLKKGTREFIGAGLPYYEHTITFNAEVPYENAGWTNGQDLSKFDEEELEAVVKKRNLQIGNLYQNKELDSLVRIEHVNGLMYGIANYRTKEKFQGIFDRYKEDVLKDKEVQPMEGYQMELYGENRIVTLRYSITNPPDPRLQGMPALYYLYKDEYGTLVDFLSLTFYLPKGKALTPENLQIL